MKCKQIRLTEQAGFGRMQIETVACDNIHTINVMKFPQLSGGAPWERSVSTGVVMDTDCGVVLPNSYTGALLHSRTALQFNYIDNHLSTRHLPSRKQRYGRLIRLVSSYKFIVKKMMSLTNSV